MTEYIEREALIKKLEDKITNPTNAFINNVLIGLLEKAPAADVAEVRHGEWLLESRIYKMPDDVDKEELIRALSYDVTQYNKGFDDGVEYGIRYILIQLKELGFFKQPEAKEVVVNLDEDNMFRKVFIESFGLGNVTDGDD